MDAGLRKGPIVVIVEHDDGIIRPVTYELLAHARKLQRHASNAVSAVILGHGIEKTAAAVAAAGCDVLAVSAPQLAHYSGQTYLYVLQQILQPLRAAWICIANSSRGSDFAPGLSLRLKAACITQVEAVQWTHDGPCFSRAILGGKLRADMHAWTETAVLTFQPGAIAPAAKSRATPGRVLWQDIRIVPQPSKPLDRRAVPSQDTDLANAKAIVAAGRGIGDETRLPQIRELAALIPNAVVCGSRPVIDAGWLPHGRQVGVTGATVSPALYIACGISGADQHVAGMRGSDFIVSINRDPAAAIFQHSDVCIVEDLQTFIPALIAAMKKEKGTMES